MPFSSVEDMLFRIPGVIIGFAMHEFAHAYVADRLGDPTPRSQGRLTLDPRSHIDLIGLIFIIIVGFGWAKPVQINPRYLRNYKRDNILISLAGPVMNLIVAIIFAVILKLILLSNIAIDNNIYVILIGLFNSTILINILLFVFNLFPIPFFDGYSILSSFVPLWKYNLFRILEQYNIIIIILLSFSGVFSIILYPPIRFIYSLIITALNL